MYTSPYPLATAVKELYGQMLAHVIRVVMNAAATDQKSVNLRLEQENRNLLLHHSRPGAAAPIFACPFR